MRALESPHGIAARVLRACARPGAFSNRRLSDELERHHGLEGGARGLVTTLVYGVLRHQARLDAHVDACADRPAKLAALPREILRIGTYEMIELGRSPGNAIAHAIAAARALDERGAIAGLVHGVLGAVAVSWQARDAALEQGAPLDVLARRDSIPRWLAGRWIKQLGPERALARGRALRDELPIDVRVDRTRIALDAARGRLAAECPGATIDMVAGDSAALRVRGGGDLFHGAMHDEGLISVQGLAAQQPARWLAPRAGESVLDACAGLGVKTLQLAELMDRRGRIVAVDREAAKIALQERLVARGRLAVRDLELVRVVGDLTSPACAVELGAWAPFDAVLLDVPCTGLGNLARHPEIRWQRRFEDIGTAAANQGVLLARALELVRPGGRLVYAVCSAEPEEGPVRIAEVVARGGISLTREQTWTPEGDGTEGFYAALLLRA